MRACTRDGDEIFDDIAMTATSELARRMIFLVAARELSESFSLSSTEIMRGAFRERTLVPPTLFGSNSAYLNHPPQIFMLTTSRARVLESHVSWHAQWCCRVPRRAPQSSQASRVPTRQWCYTMTPPITRNHATQP